jgi:hypothetical protein
MSLLEHQIILGRCLRGANVDAVIDEAGREFAFDRDQLAELHSLVHGVGFDFTRHVQRSWCIGRTASAARTTLSLLPLEQRRLVVEQWVDAGGGAALDVTSEAGAFLAFVAQRLPDPSHALSVCRMEEAAYRTSAAAASFTPPSAALLDDPDATLCRGKASTLVHFFAKPSRLFGAIAAQGALPRLGKRRFSFLFAPALPRLHRASTQVEAELWERLIAPAAVRALCAEGFSHQLMVQLLNIGAIECAGQ